MREKGAFEALFQSALFRSNEVHYSVVYSRWR
jgi:hypothetical protein